MTVPVPQPPTQPAQVVAQPSASDPTTAAAAVSSNSAQPSSTTKISSLADLKKKAPKVYNMMMLGLAQNIVNQMQQEQHRLKQIMRENGEAGFF